MLNQDDFLQLLPDSSKNSIIQAAKYVINEPEIIESLIEFSFRQIPKLSARAARVVNECAVHNPQMILPYIQVIIDGLEATNDDSIRFNILHLLTIIPLPEDEIIMGRIAEICFDSLEMPTKKIAVKVYALEILKSIAFHYPEIVQEIKLIIQKQYDYVSIAFQSRANKVLSQLSKMKKKIHDE